MIEILGATGLLALAPWFALLAWGPIRNLFEESQDNTPGVYFLFGAPFLLAALCCVLGALLLLLHAFRRRS